jgi:multimeric flavodoxin WrbA
MSKVVAIVSSPRHDGNSAAIVNSVIDGAMGLSTNIISLHCLQTMLIHGCSACGSCKSKGRCVTEDELTRVLDDIKDADGIVVSTPVYFGGPCAQYKMFEDRLFSFISNDGTSLLPKGKKAVVVVTCGGPEEIGASVCEHVSKNLEFLGVEIIGKIVYSDRNGSRSADDDKDVLSEAKELGKVFRTNYREYDPHYHGPKA